MRLSDEDVELYYRLMWGLLYYTNQRHHVMKALDGPDLRDRDPHEVSRLNELLFSHPGLMDSFVDENPLDLAPEELDIVRGWKRFIDDRFLVVEHAKEHSVLVTVGDDMRAYGVVGLNDGMREIVGDRLPRFVETIILPFKGRIVYCGLLGYINVLIGPTMRRGIMAEYKRARSRFGVITSLDGPVEERGSADEEMLRYYLGSERRRKEHWHDIADILERRPGLKDVCSQELGRSYARTVRKRLKGLGAGPAWFAAFEELVVASGASEEDAMERARVVVGDERMTGVHVFRFKRA